jgi:hypothetical protein
MFYIIKNSNERNLTLKERPYCIKQMIVYEMTRTN